MNYKNPKEAQKFKPLEFLNTPVPPVQSNAKIGKSKFRASSKNLKDSKKDIVLNSESNSEVSIAINKSSETVQNIFLTGVVRNTSKTNKKRNNPGTSAALVDRFESNKIASQLIAFQRPSRSSSS